MLPLILHGRKSSFELHGDDRLTINEHDTIQSSSSHGTGMHTCLDMDLQKFIVFEKW